MTDYTPMPPNESMEGELIDYRPDLVERLAQVVQALALVAIAIILVVEL